jgi:hypothetical protein
MEIGMKLIKKMKNKYKKNTIFMSNRNRMDRHQLAKRVKRYKNKIKTTFYKEDYRVKYR